MAFQGFDRDFPAFLKALARNNDKKWFDVNKAQFRRAVQDPFLEMLTALAETMEKISPHIVVDPKRANGAMQRIYRDTRFGKDKTPYHTHVAAILKHEQGKKQSAPGYYLRVDLTGVTVGCGIMQPESPALAKLRDAIVADPKAWQKARDNRKFCSTYGELAGESLKRAPRGYDAEHPCVDDLRRKDFVAFQVLPLASLHDKKFVSTLDKTYRAAVPLMQWLCAPLELDF
ncbi:MAG: hypothetical protein ACI9S9_003679 [Planctomycetota bacterium]|jgi:uncharacterized protein (TIGR02453 family)